MRRGVYLGLSLLPLLASAFVKGGAAPVDEDPIARLDLKALRYEPRHGYLKSLLAVLGIDPASQALVFSKTSLQSDFIGPKTPRALYFNAETYVGWIPGAPLIEIMTVHPMKGVRFYTLRNDKPRAAAFEPESGRCFRCHGGRSPALFASSSPVPESGYPRVNRPTYDVTPALPLRQRWGGWYVSGTHGAQRHMGNELSIGTDERNRIDVERGANVTDLRRYFDVKPYLTPHSDIVALMTMEAQMEVQNAIGRTASQLRAGEGVEEACEPLVEALLGVGEARLTAPIEGTSGFVEGYARGLPKDAKGRSLGEFDLRTRLFKYPCSPLILSASFDALPPAAKAYVGGRLGAILSGKDTSATFSHLTTEDRSAVGEILRETKPGLLPSLR